MSDRTDQQPTSPGATDPRVLLPAEHMALTVGLAQIRRGDSMTPNIAGFLALALERLAAADAADRAAGIVRVRLVDLPDPEKLHLLADWLDMDDVIKNRLGNVEVQSDLRKWARAVAALTGEQ